MSSAVRSFASVVVVLLAALCLPACRTTPQKVVVIERDGGDSGDGAVVDVTTREAPASCSASPATRLPTRSACGCNDDCVSGFCVDGVCCDTACNGTCVGCNVAGRAGTCSPLPAGVPPLVAGQCPVEGPATCGRDGTCDGSGQCRKYIDGTVCAAGRCDGSSVVDGKVCTGGSCQAGPATVCSPFACDTTTNSCFEKCTGNGQCDGRTCANGSCGKKPLGATCTGADQCDSSFCADGVCCNLSCTGACVSCNQTSHMGQCSPVAAGGTDAHHVCAISTRESCGTSGLCNGLGGCAKYAAGTECKAGNCSGGSEIPISVCDGVGTCLIGAPVSCSPFVCTGTACKVSCTSDADCTAGNICRNGSCGKKQNGQTCKTAVECKSNFCVDGVCCDTGCSGSCVYCASPNARGRCTNVAAGVPDPRSVCQDNGAAGCGTNGKCNGNKACQTYPNGTTCKGSSCNVPTNGYTQNSVCRDGKCETPAAASCAPYKCNGANCGNSCASNNDCTAPNTYQNGSCGKKSLGALCARPDECTSNVCAQGVCCQNACTGSCMTCNRVGMAGTCGPVAAGGSDPAGVCKDNGPSSCGTDGVCNGSGACRKYLAGTMCAAPTCTNGTFRAASSCNSSGTCVAGATRGCAPYSCNASGSDCFNSCMADAQCVSPNRCDGNGTCGKKQIGVACADGQECTSGFCVEGVCCNSACGVTCKSCALPGTMKGTCTNVLAGNPDPGGGCALSAQQTCGNDGTCSGNGTCRKWAATTVCRAASCPSGAAMVTPEARCDGNGTCPTMGSQPCAPYKCDPSTNQCRSTCMGDGDCSAGACDPMGSCGKKAIGTSCANGSECANGNCVDGVCCMTASCGTCKSCAVGNGTCVNVPNNQPGTGCADVTDSNACGTTGVCNGNGACKFVAAGQSCGQVCVGANLQVRTCDGNGTCSGTNISCSNNFVCSNNSCGTCSTTTDEGCVTGKVCVGGNRCDDPTPPATDAGM